ncbi:MAG: hypothetical protein ACE5IJ_09280, partial [Thermoplasmata archaeon]
KLIEGAIATIETSELKNYTHGRYISAFTRRKDRERVIVLFSTPRDEALVDYLLSKFSRFFATVKVETVYQGFQGGFDLLMKSLCLADSLGSKCGIDISRPRYPSEARGLYGWGPIYQSSETKPSFSPIGISVRKKRPGP